MMRKVLFIGLLIGFSALAVKGWHWAKAGFNVHRIGAAIVGDEKVPSIPDAFEDVMKQPYFYLGQGRQFYAFSSQDGNYVLKFPRFQAFDPPLWLKMTSFPFLKNYGDERERKRIARRAFLLESVRMAFEEFGEQTALLWVHFYQTQGNHVVQLFDRMGKSCWVDLDRTPFVLQKKKDLMGKAVLKALEQKDQNEMKRILEAFLKLTADRSKKRILNKDHCKGCIGKFGNFGFDGKNAFEIDVGSYYRLWDASAKTAFYDTIDPVGHWLRQVDPQLSYWFQERAQAIAESF